MVAADLSCGELLAHLRVFCQCTTSGAKSHVLDPRPGHSQVTSSWHPALGEGSLARACKSFIGRGRDGDEIAVDGEVERDRCGQIGRCEPLRKPSRAKWETVTAGLTSARDRQPALIGRPGREPAVRARYRTGQAGLHSVTVLAGTHAWVLRVLAGTHAWVLKVLAGAHAWVLKVPALLPMGPLAAAGGHVYGYSRYYRGDCW